MDIHSVRDWLTALSLLVSGAAMGALLARRSFGSYAGQIAAEYTRQTCESNEGVRRSEELTRQSNERVVRRIDEHAAEEQVVIKASYEILSEIMKVRHEMRCRVLHQSITDTERIA
jgi:hypothetical protein